MAEALLVKCEQCGAVNRIPQEKLQGRLTAVCGRCKTELAIQAKPEILTDASFADAVGGSSLPVLVDMWAPWCGPCRFLSPVVEQLAAELAGRLRVAKMNVDENPTTAARFQIQSIPALLVFQGGREVDRIVGAQPKSEIRRRLDRFLAS